MNDGLRERTTIPLVSGGAVIVHAADRATHGKTYLEFAGMAAPDRDGTATLSDAERAALAAALLPRDRDPSGCGELLREATERGWHVEMRAWPGRITAHVCTDEAEWLGSGQGDSPEAALRAALDRAKGAGG